MDTGSARRTIIDSYMAKRRVPEREREHLATTLLDELNRGSGDILGALRRVTSTERQAYIDTQTLYLLAGRVDKPEPEDHRFIISRAEWAELDCEYEAYLSYKVVEDGQRGWGLDKNWMP